MFNLCGLVESKLIHLSLLRHRTPPPGDELVLEDVALLARHDQSLVLVHRKQEVRAARRREQPEGRVQTRLCSGAEGAAGRAQAEVVRGPATRKRGGVLELGAGLDRRPLRRSADHRSKQGGQSGGGSEVLSGARRAAPTAQALIGQQAAGRGFCSRGVGGG